ncbi:MAG: SDR family NAD(P)-dependent oxidoreductase [Bryobacteraceae bacterium]
MAVRRTRYLTPAILTTSGALLTVALANSALRKPKPIWSASGKVVVITGSSRGLGLILAEEFALAGAKVVLVGRSVSELERAKNHLLSRRVSIHSDQILMIPCDLRLPEDCKRLIDQATDHWGRVDVLINNAGVIHIGPVEQLPLETYRESMEIDYFATVQTTYAVLPQMLRRGEGKIVNITSIGGKIPVPHLASYVGSKFAAVGFSETLNAELKSKGIQVTTVCPGLMRTGSYPNAIVVGQREREYRWFSLSASIPGIAHSAEGAARKIFEATTDGRTEITVGLDAYLAARVHGLAPELTQYVASLANEFILPEPGGSETPLSAQNIRPPRSKLWRIFSDLLTRTHNQPSA